MASHSKLVTKTKPKTDAYAMLRHFLVDMGVSTPTPLPDQISSATFTAVSKTSKKSIDAADSKFIAAMLEYYRDDQGQLKSAGSGKLESVMLGLGAMTKGSGDQHHRRFTPAELLTTLQKELIANETRVNFDYVSFSRHCMSLLVQFIGSATSEPAHIGEVPGAAYRLLKEAADTYAKSESDEGNESIANTPFAAGCAVVQDSLAGGQGNRFCQAALGLSSGHLHKENRPAATPNPEKVVPEAAIEEFLRRLGPGASISSSRRTIEVYDPTGNVEKMDWIFNDPSMTPIMEQVMPDGKMMSSPTHQTRLLTCSFFRNGERDVSCCIGRPDRLGRYS